MIRTILTADVGDMTVLVPDLGSGYDMKVLTWDVIAPLVVFMATLYLMSCVTEEVSL